MSLFKRALKIDLGNRVITLNPGDFIVLTQDGEGGAGTTKFKASVTWKYAWDGHTLKKVWE